MLVLIVNQDTTVQTIGGNTSKTAKSVLSARKMMAVIFDILTWCDAYRPSRKKEILPTESILQH